MQEPIQLGPFELSHVIGRGGMGEVWAGVHGADRMAVAVKVLTSQGAHQDEFVRLFRNEIRSVATLDHPGIVRVLDMGAVDVAAEVSSTRRLSAGSPYLVMELAHKGSLEPFVSNVTWPIIRHLLLKVLDALSHAHARGLVHRDLKPQNLLVGCAGSDPLGLKIADFGLAHPMDLTGRTGRFEQGWGTPHYMAPEQFRGRFRDYGPHTDLYALGVVGWELSTGALPFDSDSTVELSALHLHQDLPIYRPRLEVPEGFEGWLRRLLQKDFRDRFPSAAHAAYALRLVLGEDELLERSDFSSVASTPDSAAQTQPIGETRGETHLLRTLEGEGGSETRHGISDTTMLVDMGGFEQDELQAMLTQMDAATRSSPESAMSTMHFSKDDFNLPESGAQSQGEALAEVLAPPPPLDWHKRGRLGPTPQLLGAGLGLYGLRTVRMVDRQAERDALWETLRQVHRDHQAQLVILRGRTGAGKSRIARWLCERASEVGAAHILTASHSELDAAGDGLAPLFARHFGCVGLNRVETQRRLERVLRADGVAAPYEWRAMTEFISPFQDTLQTAEQMSERVQLSTSGQRFALLRRAIERIARDQPVIVWLDDVQWGAEALAWAQFLLAGSDPTRAPILWVATAHEDILAERPAESTRLDALANLGCATTHYISPLDAEDTAELVRRLLMLEGGLAEQVEQRSGGNPLFAVQLVGDWVSTGKLQVGERGFRMESGEQAIIPDEVHQIWRDRVNYVLDASSNRSDTRQALELAAALGISVNRTEWHHACDAAGLDVASTLEDTLFGHALATLGRDFSAEGHTNTSLRTGWRFAHRMLRESLERVSLEAGRWSRLNSICADTLAALYPDAPAYAQRRAHYLSQAARVQEAATTFLLAARYRSQRSELSRAHQLLDELDELLDSAESGAALAGALRDEQVGWKTRDRTRSWTLRSEIFGWAGLYSRALEFGDLATESAQKSGASFLIAPAFCARGYAYFHLGDIGAAKTSFESARDAEKTSASDTPLPREGLSLLGLARVAQARGAFADAQELLEGARDLFEKNDTNSLLARCYNALGDVARKTQQLVQARDFASRARALFDATGNQAGVADCLNDLAELHYLLDDPNTAESHGAEALNLYESIGSKRAMSVRLILALVWIERREFERARRALADAREHFEREQQRCELAHANVLLLACAAHQEDWSIWNTLIAQADMLRKNTGLCDPQIARAAAVAAQVARACGDPDRAAQAHALSEAFAGV